MILVVLLLNKRASASCVPMIALYNERKGGRKRDAVVRERERERRTYPTNPTTINNASKKN